METVPVEEMADLAHEIWANWMKYMFGLCNPTTNGGLVIPPELVERWKQQMNTPYHELSEKEKESDRGIAIQYLDVML